MADLPFSAHHLPGLTSRFDPTEAVLLGARWLTAAAADAPNGPIVVVNGRNIADNPRLHPLGRHVIVTPQTKRPHSDGHAVLAVWPSAKALELAEQLAQGGALCLIPGNGYDVGAWLARTGAADLTDPDRERSRLTPLAPDVQKAIDYLLQFAGHNSFVGSDDKRTTVVTLRELRAAGHELDPELIAAHAAASGETDHGGAAQLRAFVEGVNADRAYRDYTGKI